MGNKVRKSLWQEVRTDLIPLGKVSVKLFAIPKFNIPYQPISWIVYCFLLAIYFNIWFIMALFLWGWEPWYPRGTNNRAKYFVFGSDWAYMCACAYVLLRAITTLMFHVKTGFKETSATVLAAERGKHGNKEDKESNKLPWLVQIVWFLQYSAYPVLLTTSVTRWAIDTGIVHQYSTNVIDIHHHGIGIFLLVVDFFLLASPFRLQHIVYTPIGLFIWVIFTVIYYLAGGTNEHHLFEETDGKTYIYREHLDWGMYPWTSVVTCVLLVFGAMPALHFIFYLLRNLRDTFIEWYYFNKTTT